MTEAEKLKLNVINSFYMIHFSSFVSQVKFFPRILPQPACRLDCFAVLFRLIPLLLVSIDVSVFVTGALYRFIASSVWSFQSPRTTSCGIQTLTCSSGQPWVEKIMVCQFLVHISPSPRFDSILDRLPDLSTLQSRVCPFCSRRWPGSVCVDHRRELLRFTGPSRPFVHQLTS